MVKDIFSLLVIFSMSHLYLFGQEVGIQGVIINYDIIYNTEYPITRDGVLAFNSDQMQSVFIQMPGNQKKTVQLGDDNVTRITTSSKVDLFNHFNFKSKKLISKEKVVFNSFIVEEQIPTMQWELHSDEKSIDDVLVKKATTSFRGRKYIAWLNLDYSFKIGPWKFNNTPGLIFEIYDETKRYHWLLRKINPKALKKDIDRLFNTKNQGHEVISIKEYAHKVYDEELDVLPKSKLPRGINVISIKTKRPARNRKEILFEWEEKKTNATKD